VDADRSFELIYRRHRREVYGSVLRDLRDPDEAEDVTQAAFLNAFRAMRRGDRPEKPRAWLLTIARNVVRRRARQRAEQPQEVELDSEPFLTLGEEQGSASADIHAALLRLTEAQREAILLREIQGRSYAEIAFELGLSLAAVEALIFRARRALAEELELADRVPIVRPPRRHGLLGLPALAKGASFSFSFGRIGFACLMGCAVLGTVPVGNGAASDEPAVAKARRPHAVVGSQVLPSAERAHPAGAKEKKEKKRASPGGGKPAHHHTSPAREEKPSDGVSLLPLELPAVELPPVESPVPLPAVEVPPLPPLPEVPEVSDLPPVPPLTS
jgi:RNA polymerase sigma factor (sigma-70 family)